MNDRPTTSETTAFTAEEMGWVLSARDEIALNRRCERLCLGEHGCECMKRAEAALRRIMK